MLFANNNDKVQPIGKVFNEEEINCLQQISDSLQGFTEKTKIKNNLKRLSRANWIIARLGG